MAPRDFNLVSTGFRPNSTGNLWEPGVAINPRPHLPKKIKTKTLNFTLSITIPIEYTQQNPKSSSQRPNPNDDIPHCGDSSRSVSIGLDLPH